MSADHLIQGALPRILSEVGEEHFIDVKKKLKEGADYAYEVLNRVKGLQPIKTQAGNYLMVRVNLE